MKKRKIVMSFIMIALIVMIAAYLAGNRQDYEALKTGQDREALKTGQDREPATVKETESTTQEKDPGQSAETNSQLSKQETDALINQMSDSLSDLEETVNSLDDVSDSDLVIPE